MRNHIDWLTFTGSPIYNTNNDEGYAEALNYGLWTLVGEQLHGALFGDEPSVRERSRAPYSDSWEWKEQNITLYASPTLSHFTVEISGQGCEKIIAAGLMNELLTKVAERVTRIDLASDIETNTIPTNFVRFTKHDRMRASGYQNSASGTTCYVGSQKSERYARVYRYNPPHPRSHLLRVEHVFRRDHAKAVAASISTSGLDAVTLTVGETFGWQHSDWQPSSDTLADISVISKQRENGKTIFWLTSVVASSFKRLCQDGTIRNPNEFLTKYFLPEGESMFD